MNSRGPVLILCCILCRLPAQQQLWEVWPTSADDLAYGNIATFADFDGDGYDDLLVLAHVHLVTGVPFPYTAIRILSGRDGSVLHEQPIGYSSIAALAYVGDMDQDGYPDYAVNVLGAGVEVWSPHQNRLLWTVYEPATTYGWVIAGNLDVNGDGRPDLLVASSHTNSSTLWVYDNSGALLQAIDARPFGYIIEGLAGVGDLDGDGCDDYVVGAFDPSQRGTVVLMSGRTGTPIRQHFGPQRGDAIGHPVAAAGDMDGDGVMDYVAGSYFGWRGVIEVFSGADGHVLHLWTDPNGDIGHALITRRDFDLDGVLDVFGAAPGYLNSTAPSVFGRVLAYSGRDERLLWDIRSAESSPSMDFVADLGVQPGSPYPVVAYLVLPNLGFPNYHRIHAVRANLPGTTVTGTGCSSAGNPPAIGLRQSPGFGRLHLSGAPPGALAHLLLAPAGQTTFGSFTLPLDLGSFGMPGCMLLVPPAVSIGTPTGTTGFDRGYAAFDLPLGLVPAGGFPVAAQWLVLDPATLGHALTPRHGFRVQ